MQDSRYCARAVWRRPRDTAEKGRSQPRLFGLEGWLKRRGKNAFGDAEVRVVQAFRVVAHGLPFFVKNIMDSEPMSKSGLELASLAASACLMQPGIRPGLLRQGDGGGDSRR